ncbi:MAG: sugar transferase [Lachnospiraceae bacterium]|nr:sugar transferase [Lachnospiraceae bacterium]
MKHFESIKRITVLQLAGVGILANIIAYAYVWYKYYIFDVQVVFWRRGNWVVVGIYAILIMFFMMTYGGNKIGYLKPFEVFLSQVLAILASNLITYLQLSVMVVWFANVKPIGLMTLAQILFALFWVYLSNFIYRNVFPPRMLLLIHGDHDTEDIKRKFDSRKDRYVISEQININAGIEVIEDKILERFDGVILWDLDMTDRNELIKYCYGKSIRVYLMPKIPDVIIMGADRMNLFDSQILLTREYAMTIEQRFIKRLIDIVCSFLLIIITSPIMLITAIIVKLYDGGPVFYKQVRLTKNNKEFKIIKFRSMRVDAEKVGGAQLAKKDDKRITPIGKFIRAVRIDELPQLFNILKGDMTFIGPRPERPEIAARYIEEMPEFAYRTKVKAGLAGYAQVYGKYNTTPYDKLKLDLTYIENYTTWLDIKLMLLTLKVLFLPDSTEGIEEGQTTASKSSKGN